MQYNFHISRDKYLQVARQRSRATISRAQFAPDGLSVNLRACPARGFSRETWANPKTMFYYFYDENVTRPANVL